MLGHSSNNKCVCRNNLDWASGWWGGGRQEKPGDQQAEHSDLVVWSVLV